MNASELRERLHDPRMNLSALAELSGVPLRTIRRIKNGHGDVLSSTLERLALPLKTVFKEAKRQPRKERGK
jgi:hypothetical protein